MHRTTFNNPRYPGASAGLIVEKVIWSPTLSPNYSNNLVILFLPPNQVAQVDPADDIIPHAICFLLTQKLVKLTADVVVVEAE